MECLHTGTIVRIAPEANEKVYRDIGANIVWIHTGKIWNVSTLEQVQLSKVHLHTQIERCLTAGKEVCIDIVSSPRTICWSEAESLPNGDFYRDVQTGYRFILVGNEVSGSGIKQLDYLFTLPVLKLSELPLSDIEIHKDDIRFYQDPSTGYALPKYFYFGDEEVVVEIEKILRFESQKLVFARVIKGGRLWGQRMKMNALELDITGFIEVPMSTDMDILDTVQLETRQHVTFIALSFANPESVIRLREILNKKGFHANILAKIESRDGVLRIAEILEYTQHIMIALGDLVVVCRREGWDINSIIEKLFQALSEKGIKRIYIASGFADSLRTVSEEAALSESETIFLKRIVDLAQKYNMNELIIGLTKETFTVDPLLAVSIESRVRTTLEHLKHLL